MSGRLSPKFYVELAKVALGEADADLAIVNGRIVNVYTGEVLDNQCILVKNERIALVGKYTGKGIGPHTQVVDAAGKVIIPGFIDGHTHMDYLISSREIARFAVLTGTTTIITETAEIAFRSGYRGITAYLKSTEDQPVKFWFTLAPMGTVSPVSREHRLTMNEVRRLLRRKDCVGAGETYWGAVNAGEEYLLEVIKETLRSGKKVEGHSAGAAGNKLQAYVSLGITSDHEPITPEETLERLRLGLSVMVREGEVRQDLEAVSRIKEQGIDLRRLAISTDGIGPWQLINRGFMDYLVQKAIDLGFSPVEAIRMGTLNVAEHFNLQDIIGGIAPGRFADMVILPDLDTIKPEMVISSGKIAARNGALLTPPRQHTYPAFMQKTVNLSREFQASDFAVFADTPGPAVKLRIIDQVTGILTREAVLELPSREGQVRFDTAQDIIKVAAVEYVFTGGKTFTGFIRGLGLKQGAVATSTCWDSTNLIVVGVSETDMAQAVNRIRHLQGGTVVCLNGSIAGEAAFPIGSIISDEPVETLAEKLSGVQQAVERMGCTVPDIRTTLSVLTTPAIPYLRICESGLFDIRQNRSVSLII